ncbi:DUF3179 domain-containing protein [Sediminicurvatus halobius]|nr:DUF3179 domain-containing protein [Spiribacter halobius]UEX77794.1 DUF3179 domain-containing protein [Spiribacter halobius]
MRSLFGLMALAPVAAALAGPPLAEPPFLPQAPAEYREARLSGGPPKDGIPSIDEPRFESAAAAGDRLADGDRIIGIHIDGEARAYPQAILVWHEIVNDTVGDTPVSVTYCPLTGTALGFRRGETTFGVSGRLVNSNLVMYDRASDTQWPQMLAAGIDGPHAGDGLQELRVVWTTWARWRERYPHTRVLTEDTGSLRRYGSDPYGQYNPRGGYYAEDAPPVFPVMHESDRYPPKHEVLGFRDADHAYAVDRAALRETGVLRHEANGRHYLIVHDPGLDTGWVFRGEAPVAPGDIEFGPDGPRIPGRDSLTAVNAFEAMWFAWAGFYPETAVIGGGDR